MTQSGRRELHPRTRNLVGWHESRAKLTDCLCMIILAVKSLSAIFMAKSSEAEMSFQGDKSKSEVPKALAAQSADLIDANDIELSANLEVVRLLGHGSMATVILARDTALFCQQDTLAEAKHLHGQAEVNGNLQGYGLTVFTYVKDLRADIF